MLPNHIGIILDGNRRFAVRIMKKPWIGHYHGIKKSREVVQWTCEKGIKYMTAYVLSLENMATRPKAELGMILKYLRNETNEVIKNRNHVIHRFKIKTRFIGRLPMLPDDIQENMRKIEGMTRKYKKHFLNVAVAYGGQQEIIDAVKKILEKGLKGIIKPSDLNEKLLKDHLYTNGQPFPDMILRTGGEKRLSNFLPFQSAYSELIFLDKKWPEMSRQDFDEALEEYSNRKRRFGK